MLYGLIGEHLTHSYSCEIHASIADYNYELKELAPDELDDFFKKREWNAVNVTIPYKETVMKYLDFISDTAKEIGAVNTIVKRDGILYGYNTDFAGMKAMLEKYGIAIKDKKVLILGTGGTCNTAFAVSNFLGAKKIIKVSRSKGDGVITYEDAIKEHRDAEVIINTTPVGMFSRQSGKPIDISVFPDLSGVVDVIYNPLRTELVTDAMERGIASCGGLYMLAGLKKSSGSLENGMTKVHTYKHVNQLGDEFIEMNKTLICRELKGLDGTGMKRTCSGCIEDAAKLVEKYLIEK